MEIKTYELGEILGLAMADSYIDNLWYIPKYQFEYLNRSEWRVIYREDYEIEGWTGNWSADELIQLVCRTSNGQVSEKEVRNLFGEAFNEERND